MKPYVYTTLVVASVLYRGYCKDAEGVALSLFALPLCILLFFREDK